MLPNKLLTGFKFVKGMVAYPWQRKLRESKILAPPVEIKPPSNISEAGINLIIRFEGIEYEVYICPAGVPTIGVGHAIYKESEKEYYKDRTLTDTEARNLLMRDLKTYVKAVRTYINVPLTQSQFDALTSFTFNLGVGALRDSTLRKVINRGEHDEVEAQLMRWVRAGGVRLNGLVARRRAEAKMYNS